MVVKRGRLVATKDPLWRDDRQTGQVSRDEGPSMEEWSSNGAGQSGRRTLWRDGRRTGQVSRGEGPSMEGWSSNGAGQSGRRTLYGGMIVKRGRSVATKDPLWRDGRQTGQVSRDEGLYGGMVVERGRLVGAKDPLWRDGRQTGQVSRDEGLAMEGWSSNGAGQSRRRTRYGGMVVKRGRSVGTKDPLWRDGRQTGQVSRDEGPSMEGWSSNGAG